MCVTKKQVLAVLAVYAVTRGVIDELRPANEMSAESTAFDKAAFDATMASIEAKVQNTEGGCCHG